MLNGNPLYCIRVSLYPILHKLDGYSLFLSHDFLISNNPVGGQDVLIIIVTIAEHTIRRLIHFNTRSLLATGNKWPCWIVGYKKGYAIEIGSGLPTMLLDGQINPLLSPTPITDTASNVHTLLCLMLSARQAVRGLGLVKARITKISHT